MYERREQVTKQQHSDKHKGSDIVTNGKNSQYVSTNAIIAYKLQKATLIRSKRQFEFCFVMDPVSWTNYPFLNRFTSTLFHNLYHLVVRPPSPSCHYQILLPKLTPPNTKNMSGNYIY